MVRGLIAGILGVVLAGTIAYFSFSEIRFTTAFTLAAVGTIFGFALGVVVSTLQIRMGAHMAFRSQESSDNTQIAQNQSLEYVIKTVVGSTLNAQYELFKQAMKNTQPAGNQQQGAKFPPLLPTSGPVTGGGNTDQSTKRLTDGNADSQVFDADDFTMTGFDQ